MESTTKEIIKALCMEYQLGFPQPRNAQECLDLANSLLQNAMLEFCEDRIVQSNLGIVTQEGFRISLAFEGEEAEDATEEP